MFLDASVESLVAGTVGYLASVNDESPGMFRGFSVVGCGALGLLNCVNDQYRDGLHLSLRNIAVLAGNSCLLITGMMMVGYDNHENSTLSCLDDYSEFVPLCRLD